MQPEDIGHVFVVGRHHNLVTHGRDNPFPVVFDPTDVGDVDL
jgi:hypothetical protein